MGRSPTAVSAKGARPVGRWRAPRRRSQGLHPFFETVSALGEIAELIEGRSTGGQQDDVAGRRPTGRQIDGAAQVRGSIDGLEPVVGGERADLRGDLVGRLSEENQVID